MPKKTTTYFITSVIRGKTYYLVEDLSPNKLGEYWDTAERAGDCKLVTFTEKATADKKARLMHAQVIERS